jgi:hypothetical protein
MVPFEFASVLLLVAMIGTVLLSKKKQRNNMNNILNEIGIEKHFPFYDTFFCIGVFGVLYRRNAIIVFMFRNYAERSQSFVCCISTYHQDAQGQIFVFSLWL